MDKDNRMQKQFYLLFIVPFSLILNLYAQNYPPVSLNSAHVRTIKSNVVKGMEYEICIALPEGYNDTTLIYPVVYMLDGYDLFGLQLQTYQQLVYHEHIPQLILVGINYSFGDKEYYSSLTDYEYIRFRDYTPTYISHQQLVEDFGEEYAGYVKESGGSGKFLRFLQEELIPFIDSEYRTDPNDRGILGYSQAGLFTTYVLFCAPETFQKIFIGSPALWWDNEVIFSYYDESKYKRLINPVKVYLSIGELEGSWLHKSYQKLNKFLQEKQNPKTELTSEILQGEKHLTGIGLAYSRAFSRLFGKP